MRSSRVFCLILFVVSETAAECVYSMGNRNTNTTVYSFYETKSNVSLVADPMTQIMAKTTMQCVMECTSRSVCHSMNVMKMETNLFNCSLFSVSADGSEDKLIATPGVDFVAIYKQNFADCEDHRLAGCRANGPYQLTNKTGEDQFITYCDMETKGGGWTVVQRRFDGSVSFDRGWDDYKHGFGNVSGEFWLGLDRMHKMTSTGDHTLRFDMWNGNDHRFAEYKNTIIASEADGYRLNYAEYQGSAGDSLAAHASNSKFSTPDKDNDGAPQSCAAERKSGFWYGYCSFANPNGVPVGATGSETGKHRNGWSTFGELSRMEMKLKRNG